MKHKESKLIVTGGNQILVRTNGVPRNLTDSYELSEKERKDFDYLSDEDFDCASFIRYKGRLYDAGEFMRVEKDSPFSPYWYGIHTDSYFSGVLIRIDPNDPDRVIVGTFYS